MISCEKKLIDELKDLLAKRGRIIVENPSYSRAAVLLPLFKKEENCHLIFTKRTDQVKYHKGQISFPGGAFDKEDVDLKRTALRETSEEIGLQEADVQIIGMLDDTATNSDFIVTPFVGLFPYPYPFQLSDIETAELIEVPLLYLFDDKCFADREIIDGDRREVVPSYQYGKHIIWGVTGRILKQFLDLISSLPSFSVISEV